MGFDAWLTLGVLGLILLLLSCTQLATDLVLVAGLTLLLSVPVPADDGWRIGVLSITEALAGFSNPGPVTVGVLFVVATGLVESGGVDRLVHYLLGRPRTLSGAQARMILPVIGVSAVLNNTTVVAMFIPAISDWAKKLGRSASQFMMPLSYAAILGGTCTLIGTSTNIVVHGLMVSHGIKGTDGSPGMRMFDITWVGLPCALVGALYLMLAGRRLLPDRSSTIGHMKDPREYTVEMIVDQGGPLIGRTIEDAGLRHLPGLYLMEIQRKGEVIAAVGPHRQLQAEDRLVFVGIVESVKDLQKIRGLVPATNQVFKLDAPRHERTLVEAVVSNSCPLVGKTIREGRFRTTYNAAVIAVGRNGERIQAKIGDIELRAGDTLLLEARPSFAEQQRNSRDFFLVSAVADSTPPRHEKGWLALAILTAMVVAVTAEWLDMLVGSLLAASLMILTRCCSVRGVRQSIEWPVLIVIAAALGIGEALQKTGAAHAFVEGFMGLTGDRPWAALAVIYGLTLVVTELITNNAAAALMFPFAIATANHLGVSHMPFVIAVTMAASAGFATPLGYQTHLMVMGPGGYRFSDFLRVGIPLDLLVGITAVVVTPFVFPFGTGT